MVRFPPEEQTQGLTDKDPPILTRLVKEQFKFVNVNCSVEFEQWQVISVQGEFREQSHNFTHQTFSFEIYLCDA